MVVVKVSECDDYLCMENSDKINNLFQTSYLNRFESIKQTITDFVNDNVENLKDPLTKYSRLCDQKLDKIKNGSNEKNEHNEACCNVIHIYARCRCKREH